MTFDLSTLFILGVAYLVMLFGIAFATEKGWIPQRITRHPIVYVLSLGVFASVWSYYAATGNAFRDGFGYLAPFIGISLAFLFSPVMLRPLLDITKSYQLSSLADLLAFRYRSPLAGTLTTIVMLIGVTPLLSLQIQAVANSVAILTPEASQTTLAIVFCVLITLFAIFFGTGRGAGREKHEGLVMAIAFESVVKLLAMLTIGWFAVYEGFGGFAELDAWLQTQPELLAGIKEPDAPGSFHVTAILFFTAAVATPHMFYMIFNENNDPKALTLASWALPLYFLLLSLPVFPVLWAGLKIGSSTPLEYYPVTLGIDHGSEIITLIGFLGGLSAASGLIIVITLALSNMCLNHLILPIYQPTARNDIYRWLLWKRRTLIAALIWIGFLFYYIPDDKLSVRAIGNVSYIASLQFLPSIVALLYWPRGNRNGFVAGLLIGVAIWFLFLMLPVATGTNLLAFSGINTREIIALSLVCNIALFIVVSLWTRTSAEERASADICALDTIRRRNRTGLIAKSPDDFIAKLAKPLGERTATREVLQAMRDLKIDKQEKRPHAMRLLRGRLEANLSGLLGPSISHDLIDRFLPYTIESEHGSTDVDVIESRIEAYRSNLSGMAEDLDNLRRYHRQVLLELPLGVCSLGEQNQIVMWNQTMEKLTGTPAQEVLGSQLNEIGEPWSSLIHDFTVGDTAHAHKRVVQVKNSRRFISLHKAIIEKSATHKIKQDGVVILLEDLTETELLEEELTHSERLASIGRLAAGVAHEIGNPITGIACLAQNIRDETDNDELRSMARQIIEQTDRTSRIVQSLVNFAHSGSNKLDHTSEIVTVEECIREAIALISLDKKRKEINYVINCKHGLQILGDSQRLLQIMVNLVNNAHDASPANSKITLASRLVSGSVQISVTDEGTGIPEAIRDRIFDPFFTTKEPGEGTGLGLSLVYSIVENLNGHIDIISASSRKENPGTRVILTFPCYDGSANATGTPPESH
ncbi:MAG: ATP-binding protein [Gammaproteobacteria bacterium]|nr:ATP-binding protein [Gammaproteobacteria bacterium]MDP2140244.1 ATP-binding protein [Gammaproteobacteria bacterium]MDP2348119.1 ATP-binding protein [Gammaproteobacteria bacterium]